MTSESTLSRARSVLINELAEALVMLSEKAEARALLADLCTPAETHTLAERWHVARLLDEGDLTYREIHEATGSARQQSSASPVFCGGSAMAVIDCCSTE